jgi:hypothetical protein
MLGFSWNGTLSRTAVGATLLLLIVSYTESRFWLNLSVTFVDGSASLGQPIVLGLFVFLAYALGAVIVAPATHPEWEDLTAETLALENKELLGLVLEYRARSELLCGLGRASAVYAGLGLYNLALGFVARAYGQSLDNYSSLSYLIPAIAFGSLFSWLLIRYAIKPFGNAKRLVHQFCIASGSASE